MSLYRAVIAGLGNIAWKFDENRNREVEPLSHAGALAQEERIELAAGCSPLSEDRLLFESHSGLPAYRTIQEMVEKEAPDLVSICSPARFHYEQVDFCLRKGVSMVWLEKPPVRDLNEMDSLIDLYKDRPQSRVCVNFQRRYMRAYRELRRIFHERIHGRCHRIELTYSKGLEPNGSHLLDLLFYIIGHESDYSLEWADRSRNPSNPSFVLRTSDGVDVFVMGADLPYHNIDISLTCDKGRISVIHGGVTERVEICVEHELFPGFFRLAEEKYHDSIRGDGGVIETGLPAALADLIESYETNREPVSNLFSARKVISFIDDLRNSSAAGSGSG